LCAFGRDASINSSTDAQAIEDHLLAALEHEAHKQFGSSPIPAVRVQIARLRQRLRSFAQLQADECRLGWRLRHCEVKFDGSVALDMGEGQRPMPLRGRIDRIDFNEQTGRWRVIDYKTAETARTPHKTHHGCETIPAGGELAWFDLQLPLYHYLVSRSLNIAGEIELAYICLPKRAAGASVEPARWTPAHLKHALDRARQVVRDIRANRFDPNPEYDHSFDDFARICHRHVYAETEALEIEA
jgi:hypothetical protein